MGYDLYDTTGDLVGHLEESPGCAGYLVGAGLGVFVVLATPFVLVGMTGLLVVGFTAGVGRSIIAAEPYITIDPADYLSVEQMLSVGAPFFAVVVGVVALVFSRKWITRRLWLVVGTIAVVAGSVTTLTQASELRSEYRREYCAQPPSATFRDPDPGFDCADYS